MDERCRALVQGRTVVMSTHWFTAAMRADITRLMDAGQLAELGSHRELVMRRGRYAHSRTMQMQGHDDLKPAES